MPLCDACGSEMPLPNPLPAMTINIGSRTKVPAIKEEWATRVAPYDVDKTYIICFPCYFKALGIKP